MIAVSPTTVTFTVPGHPVTQGNHKAFVVGGVARITDKAGGRLLLWRHAISDEARKAAVHQWPLLGPVSVRMAFVLQRPQSHPKRRRTWPTGARSGDVEKLARAANDALAGVAFMDDAQVVHLDVTKDWAPTPYGPGVTITITEIGND